MISTGKNKKEVGKMELHESIEIPEKVTVEIAETTIKITGPKGSIIKEYPYKRIKLEEENSNILIKGLKNTQREYKLIKTFKSHFRNMITGVLEGYTYKLKICSSHFPMKVSLSGSNFKVENFMGERYPRTVKIKPGANVKIDGSIIVVESHDKELAGQVAADIEQLTRITNKDRRIFQDGIYMIEKAGKKI